MGTSVDKGSGRGGRRKALMVAVTAVSVVALLLVIGLTVGRRGSTTDRVEPERPGESKELLVQPWADDSGEPMSEEALSSPREQAVAPAGSVVSTQVKAIRTAEIALEIEKGGFGQAYSRVAAVAEGAGGYISDSRSDSDGGRPVGGTVAVRVPADDYGRTIEELKKLGEVTFIAEQAKDVTEEYVDLESRLDNLRAQQSVYLGLMAKAQTIEESIAVQRELSVIQEQIEQLTGRKNYLDNRVQFATIRVTLSETGARIGPDDEWGFTRALSDALHGVVDGINAVIRFTGNALVYVLLLTAAAAAAYYGLKRRGRRREE